MLRVRKEKALCLVGGRTRGRCPSQAFIPPIDNDTGPPGGPRANKGQDLHCCNYVSVPASRNWSFPARRGLAQGPLLHYPCPLTLAKVGLVGPVFVAQLTSETRLCTRPGSLAAWQPWKSLYVRTYVHGRLNVSHVSTVSTAPTVVQMSSAHRWRPAGNQLAGLRPVHMYLPR